jgi:hypothetical protein
VWVRNHGTGERTSLSTSPKEARYGRHYCLRHALRERFWRKRKTQVFRPGRRSGEDELLARVLITSWSLNTGRTPPPSSTEEELIRFWADDLIATPPADPGCQRPGR